MKALLVLAALTLVAPSPVVASQPPNVMELEIEQPQTLQQRQLEEYQKQSNEQIRQFNTSAQAALSQSYANKVLWQDILDEIQDRQIRIQQDRSDRVPRLPIR